MYVHESGSSDAPAIVFLHGNGASGLMWKAHMERLAEYRCLAPDLPGFGQTNNREWVSLAETAQEVAGLIRDRVAEGRSHVVGLSLGSATAYTLLDQAPGLIDHAIIDGAGVLPTPGLGLMKAGLRMLQPFLHTNVVIKAVARAMKVSDTGYEEFRQGMLAMSRSSFTRSFTQALSLRQPPGLENFPRPVLFVAGEKELPALLRSNALLTGVLPRAECRVAPGMGHGWLAEAPDLHVEMVRAWLSDQSLPVWLANCRS